MDVSSFFSRLVQPGKATGVAKQPDDLAEFESAWKAIQETLEHPDERQLVRGIASTDVPRHLRHIGDALVYENNRTDENETGACFEYFLRQDLLSNLERLCEVDRPHGIKGEVLRAINNLVVLLSDRFLIHNAVHRPLRRLLRSCVGDDAEDKSEGSKRVYGAAGMDERKRNPSGQADFEADLVDLMCILCSKMRAYPPLLLIFFHDKGWLQAQSVTGAARSDHLLSRALSPTPSTQTSRSHPSAIHSQSSKTGNRFEFLLFSYLLRFVHREGRTGDFARAGLLFLFDIAFLGQTDDGVNVSASIAEGDGSDPLQNARDALGEYILDGDFAEVMAAAIGAVYSLLPSKLKVSTLAEQARDDANGSGLTSGGMYLGTTATHSTEAEELASSDDPIVRSQLDILLKLFGFLQDIVTRCAISTESASAFPSSTQLLGTAISDVTLEAIQTSFLDNVLYPSILESSSTDGTSVAVMTYLQVLLSNLDDGPLLSRILHFLLDAESNDAPNLAQHHQPKRTTGAMAYVQHAENRRNDYSADGGKFTLKDLIMDNLTSPSPAARVSALQLLNIMIQEHCSFAVDNLTSVNRVYKHISPCLPRASRASQLYTSLLEQINPANGAFGRSSGYSAYLADLTSAIQSDRCFQISQLDDHDADDEGKFEITRHKRHLPAAHTIDPSDIVIQQVMQSLAAFMDQTADQNVALSSVIISLASCSRRSVEGWLLSGSQELAHPWDEHASDRPYDKSDDDQSYTSDIDEEEPPSPNLLPAVYTVLLSHIQQVKTLRRAIGQFDQLLAERRQGLLFADNLDEAMSVGLDLDSKVLTPGPAASPSHTPLKPQTKRERSSLAGSIKGFFTPRKKTLQPTTPGEAGTECTDTIAREAGADSGGSPYQRHYDTAARLKTNMGALSALPDQTQEGDDVFGGPSQTTRDANDASNLSGSDRRSLQARQEENEAEGGREEVNLNEILDNVVILEEFLKEIVAVITARKALGIDNG